jgi:Winged helix DNA-binding domain
MPRAALLSIHARVEGTGPGTWEDPALVQVWGPRFSAFVIAAEDRAVFTLGRSPYEPARRQRGEGIADRLEVLLDGTRMSYADAGHALGIDPNMLRFATLTGRVLIRWDGARRPDIWMVPAPDVDPEEARRELTRRYLHAFGPGTPAGFAEWAGLRAPRAQTAFDKYADMMSPVRTPVGDAWILTGDEPSFLETRRLPTGGVRLLPSGDAYFLCWGPDRELLVADSARRTELWPSRVWPGAVLVSGEIVGVWRRADANVTIQAWRRFTAAERDSVEREAASLPLPGLAGSIGLTWQSDP